MSISAFTFHQHVHGVPQNPDCCDQNKNGEDEGANGINDHQVRIEVDHKGGNEHSQTLKKINQCLVRKRHGIVVTISACRSGSLRLKYWRRHLIFF